MNHDLLEKCVEALKTLRTRKHEELGASVTAELDDVILRLECCLETTSNEVWLEPELRKHALETLSRCLSLATNLAEIVRWFLGSQ